MLKMNYSQQAWDLDSDCCSCDLQFNDWVEANRITGKTFYHFGTGAHHVVGLRQAELGNAVFAITASKREYDTYVALVTEYPRLAKSYLTYFGDIYLSDSRLLPVVDAVTLFHLCEFSQPNTGSAEYCGLTDRGLLDLMTGKTRPGGHILFYTGSNGWRATKALLPAWEEEHPVERLGQFKRLKVYRKTSPPTKTLN